MLELSRRIPGDWWDAAIPSNVVLGESATIESSHSFCSYRSEASPGLRMGAGAAAYAGTVFDVGPRGRVEIGDCAMLVAVRIECDLQIEIGERSLLSWEVVLMDAYRWPLDPQARADELRHALRTADPEDPSGSTLRARETRRPGARPIRIGRDVWIGFGASVLPGVSIGDGAVVGARAVVTTDVAARTLVAGNPARILRAL